MTPNLLLSLKVGAAALVTGLVLGGTTTWKVQNWRHDSAELQRKEDADELKRLRERKADVAAVGHEDFKERERVVYQTITETVDRIVDRPVYSNVCLDDDGLRALNAAIGGRADDPGKPAPAVPGSR